MQVCIVSKLGIKYADTACYTSCAFAIKGMLNA